MSEHKIILAEITLIKCGVEQSVEGIRYLIGKDFTKTIQHREDDIVWSFSITRIVNENVDISTIDVEPINWDDSNFQRIKYSIYYPHHVRFEISDKQED